MNPLNLSGRARANQWLRLLAALLLLTALGPAVRAGNLPEGFVYVSDVIPGIRVELRYQGADNFVGRPIDGYERPVAILTFEAAAALAEVQADLAAHGYGLKIFDAYRPQRAVDQFIRWAGDADDQRMKDRYYPAVDKADLLGEGYIAGPSSHSRGSTVDVTIVSLAAPYEELDMGTPWDFFDPAAQADSKLVSRAEHAHRRLLSSAMAKRGFVPLAQEWWHFTLAGEPYPDTYFDFPVR